MDTSGKKAQLRKGVLEYCILLTLQEQDCYSSDIIDTLKKVDMIVVEGTLYPLLTRLKNSGLLSYRWEESTQGPPRKYYSLTLNGKKELVELDKSWNEIIDAINTLKNLKIK